MEGILSAWGRILTGYTPALSIEITRECPLHCPGCYAYGDDHLGGDLTLREVRDFKGQEREVASTVEDLQSAAADDDASEICRTLLAKSLLDRIGGAGAGCQKAVGVALDATDTNELKVESVTVNGTNATARVKSGTGDSATTRTVQLTREGSNWKIATL